MQDNWSTLLEQLLIGERPQPEQLAALMAAWLGDGLEPVQTGAFLAALRCRGVQGPELAAMATVLRDAAVKPNLPPASSAAAAARDDLLDTCGTGGDGADTFNISTAVAFTAAACGVPVAKHGNRSASGKVGSADVLEALGVNLRAPAADNLAALDAVGLCFLFAPGWHPALKGLAPLRRRLGVRTVFNLLGPLVNPLRPAFQVLGVAQPELLAPMGEAIGAMGVRRAVIVHGSEGLDEAGLGGPSRLLHVVVHDNQATCAEETVEPAALGLNPAPLSSLAGGNPAESADLLRSVLQGRGTVPQQQVVALNTGLALLVAEHCASLQDGVTMAQDALAAGTPWDKLQALVKALPAPAP